MDVEGVEYDILEELIESGAIHKIKYIFFKLKYICIFDTYIISTYDNLLYPRVG